VAAGEHRADPSVDGAVLDQLDRGRRGAPDQDRAADAVEVGVGEEEGFDHDSPRYTCRKEALQA